MVLTDAPMCALVEAIPTGGWERRPLRLSWLCQACSCRAAGSRVFGVHVGRRMCWLSVSMPGERKSLCALWGHRGVTFPQTSPDHPGPPGEVGKPAQEAGLRLSRPHPCGQSLGQALAQRHLVGL